MSAKFKVGDRVRSKGYPKGLTGTVVRTNDDGFKVVVEFDRWTAGWSDDGTPTNRWGFDDLGKLDLVLASPAAKFQVVYVDDDSLTFDTQEAAEAAAEDLARDEIGSKFAVLRVVAILSATAPVITGERFA